MAVLKDLIVHGSSRFLNVAQFNALKADKIGAEEGIFNKVIATTGDIGSLNVEDLTAGKATVLSLLDVRGELHTNQWTNSNIATIDGSFYITPTIGVSEGTMTTTVNSLSVYGTNFPVSSVYVNDINKDNIASTVAWTTGSKVLVTGEILVNGTYMPLGTLVGTLGSNVTASRIDINNITDNRYQTATSLAEIGTQSTALPCRNVKVSLYQTSRSSTLYPLGIFMTALRENGKTFIDIYGGGYATSTAVAGGFAKPVLRIGNLAGLPTIGTQTPVGYGIYTSNGYFSGVVAAKKGIIGDGETAWTIGSGSGTGSVSYIYAPTNGPQSKTADTVGMYIGTDGINNFKTLSQYVRIYDGKITAFGADIRGALTATSLSTGNKTGSTTGRGTYIDSEGNIYTGNGSSNNFTVTRDGILTAEGAFLKTVTLQDHYGNTRAIVDGNGLKVYDSGNKLRSVIGTFDVGNETHNGLVVYNGKGTTIHNIVARFSDVNAQIGQIGSGYIYITSSGLEVHQNVLVESEESEMGSAVWMGDFVIAKIADSGSRIGRENQPHIDITPKGLNLYDESTSPYVTFEDLRDTDTHSLEYTESRTIQATDIQDDGSVELVTYLTVVTQVNSSTGTITKVPTVLVNDTSLTFNEQFTLIQEESYSVIKINARTVERVNIKKGNTVTITYLTTDPKAKIFTLGYRDDSSKKGPLSCAIGVNTVASTPYSYAEGYSTEAIGNVSHAEGWQTKASGEIAHAEGYSTKAIGDTSHAEGWATQANGEDSHAEGSNTIAYGYCSHAEGYYTAATGQYSHAEGLRAKAIGTYSHAEGWGTEARNDSAHAEGISTKATGLYSHAEGGDTVASGANSHAEGDDTLASATGSHAEGNRTEAASSYSHAEGAGTKTAGYCAHAEGWETIASGENSHTQNCGTVATEKDQTVIGRYNTATRTGSGTSSDPYVYTGVGDRAFIIGNGSGDDTNNRSNALTIGWDGCIRIQGQKLLTTAIVSRDNVTISHTDLTVVTLPAAKTGYVPIGLAGWDLDQGSSSGANVSHCNVVAAKIDGTNAYFQMRCEASSNAKIKINATVLYIAAGQGK